MALPPNLEQYIGNLEARAAALGHGNQVPISLVSGEKTLTGGLVANRIEHPAITPDSAIFATINQTNETYSIGPIVWLDEPQNGYFLAFTNYGQKIKWVAFNQRSNA